MRRSKSVVCTALMALVLVGANAGLTFAQTQTSTSVEPDEIRDLRLVLSEPDFTLGSLPTTLRLPKGKASFRITHRFTYPINDSSFGEFLENGFGFDAAATTGFELRFGVAGGLQAAVTRTGSRNIQFLAQKQLIGQRDGGPVSVDVIGAIEGQNNFREEYSYVIGAALSHQFGDQGAVYVEPMGVFHATPEFPGSDQNTMVLGLGARLRLGRSRAYLVGEFAPRISGYDGGQSLVTVAIEKRAGGHMFQLNVSNTFGTTLTQVGHGGPVAAHWHLGFNLTRKFF